MTISEVIEELQLKIAQSMLRAQEHKEAQARVERETAEMIQQRTIETLSDPKRFPRKGGG